MFLDLSSLLHYPMYSLLSNENNTYWKPYEFGLCNWQISQCILSLSKLDCLFQCMNHNNGDVRGTWYNINAGIGHGDTSSNPGLTAFHIALIPLGKLWIQLFSPQLWEIVGQTRFFSLGEATSLGEGKLRIQTC